MPQTGIHALAALVLKRNIARDAWFMLGIVFGALLPDIDIYAQAAAVIFAGFGPLQANMMLHNTFTHSLFTALGIWCGLALLSLLLRNRRLLQLGSGLALGMALLHTLPDAFFWFESVGVLWPVWSVNLWDWFHPPETLRQLLLAADFFAFSAYFIYLGVLSRRNRTNRGYKIRLRQYVFLQVALGMVFTILAILLPGGIYDMYYTFAFGLIAYPNALWVTWRMRATITSPAILQRLRPNTQALIVDSR